MSERRISAYLIGLAVLFLLFGMTAVLSKDYSRRGVNSEKWLAQNENLLDSLPTYPGAVSVAEYGGKVIGNPYPDAAPDAAETGPYQSFSTVRPYALPFGTTSDLVLSFYREQLTGWTIDATKASDCRDVFRRDKEMLEVNACDGQLELTANYKQLD